MALNSIFRRASSAALPLAVRSVATPRSIHHSIFATATIEKHNLSQELNPNFLHSSRRPSPCHICGRHCSGRHYSSAAANNKSDVSLLQILESELKCVEEDDQIRIAEIPEEFPFEIQDNPGERTISLTRKFEDETIKVEVDIPNVVAEDEEGNNDEAGEDDEQTREESSTQLVVSITKDGASGECLEFGVTAFPDEISIDHLSIRKPDGSEDQLVYEGPEFQDLDENLQKAFHKYLEIRGIKPSTTNFLHEYMINKDGREYSMWLKNLKNFVGK